MSPGSLRRKDWHTWCPLWPACPRPSNLLRSWRVDALVGYRMVSDQIIWWILMALGAWICTRNPKRGLLGQATGYTFAMTSMIHDSNLCSRSWWTWFSGDNWHDWSKINEPQWITPSNFRSHAVSGWLFWSACSYRLDAYSWSLMHDHCRMFRLEFKNLRFKDLR